MGDARVVYGLAYGKQGNWYTTWQTKTHGILAQANTAPDVTNGYLFYTINSGATTINDFKLSVAGSPDTGGNIAPLFEGKVIKIFFTDSNTTIEGSRIYLAQTNNSFQANSILDLIYHNSGWYEIQRTQPTGINEATPRYTLAGTNAIITVNSDIVNLVVAPTATPTLIKGISGGYVGQTITLIMGTATSVLQFESTSSSGLGNIYFGSSSQVCFNATNQSLVFTKVSPVAWSHPSIITA